jgi:hypothetical protein
MLHNREVFYLNRLLSILKTLKCRKIQCSGHVVLWRETRNKTEFRWENLLESGHLKGQEYGGQHYAERDMKMGVFWVVALCSLVEDYQRFRGPCCLHHQGDDDGSSKDL